MHRLSFGESLIKAVFLARRLQAAWKGQEAIGIMLPPSVACQLVNIAALLSGKVPVNLNYTCSADTIARCAERCRLRTVVTSRRFLERLPIAVPMDGI